MPIGNKPAEIDASPDALESSDARAEYPSSHLPRPLESQTGPEPLLSNVITGHRFDDAWSLGYRGAGVRVAVVDEGVDFGHLDLQGTQATVTDPSSPYFGWPIVYDPRSLTSYLTTGFLDNTYFANTTRTGLGPFDVTHTIRIDGTNDFGDRELWAVDSPDQSSDPPGGNKEDWDLTSLSLTRDDDNWYVGYPMYLDNENASFVLLFDVDNETGGAYVAPGGATVDTNTSHADRVNDVAWSPDGGRVATVAGDRLVRIWDRTGRVLHTMSGHASEPLSVAWSPDGALVASADKEFLRLWNATTGGLVREIQYVPFGEITISENGILAFSPNGTWIAASTYKYVHFFDVATGSEVGTLWAENTEVNAVAFRPNATDQIAVALGTWKAAVYVLNGTNLQPSPAARPLITLSGHTQDVLEVSWSPSGAYLVTGAKDNTAKLWDVAAQTDTPLPEAQSWVLGADWDPSGTRFAVSTAGRPSVSPSFILYDSSGALLRQVSQPAAVYGVNWSVLGDIATGGADFTARSWTSSGDFIRIFVAHRPDYALYTHGFSRFSDRENKYAHGAELATWYRWNATSSEWNSTSFQAVGGSQAALQVGGQLFNEFAIPRGLLGDPPGLASTLFSMHENGSRAQDTVPSDRNVDFMGLLFNPPGWSSLSAWAWRRIEQYSIAGLTSASNVFHFGVHPAPTVKREFGTLGVLVVDSTNASKYDRVYLDMNDDKVFDATDVVVSRSSPIAAIDTYNASTSLPGTDGYPDISAGMVYFIADGTNPVPYSERLAERKGAALTVRIPAAGNLVAFAGDFGVDPITGALSEHGTRTASAIVSQARLPAPLSGLANESRLVTILNGLSDVVEAWTFAVEGYDERPGTSDDADVVVSPFNFPSIQHDGWDVFSRTADYLSTVVSGGRAIFVASAGDYGFGYGTVTSPASGPSVIAAGRAGDFSLRSILHGGPEGPSPHVTNPAIPGSRGPSTQGFVKPELVAADTAVLAIPLHSAGDGSTAISPSPLVGSDVSAAVVGAAAALVVEAFRSSHGRNATLSEVRSLLMSGADDTGHDVLTQGAGYLNVSRSVRLAANTTDAGLEVTPSTWHPGAYRDTTYEGFTRIVFENTTARTGISLQNRGTAPISADIEALSYRKIGEYVHTNVTRKDAYEPEGDIALWVNDTGVWKVDAATLTGVRVVPPIPGLWSSATLVKVTAEAELSRLLYRQGTEFRSNYSYALKAYDWTIDWNHWFGFTPFPAPAFFPDELNTVAETFHTSNMLEVRAAFPASSLHEGLVLSLEDVGTPTFIDGLSWTFVIEFFERAMWPWVTLSSATANVSGGGSQVINVTLNIPANAGIGSYEGAIMIHDTSRDLKTTVPVLVNVAARTPSLTFGGAASPVSLYDNTRLYGGYDWALASSTRLRAPHLGDWRFFFFEIPDTGTFLDPRGLRVLVRTAWVDAPSDLDTFAFNRGGADEATSKASGAYGGFTLKQVTTSELLDKPEFRTVTGGGEEVVSYDLRSGLNVIGVRAFALRGLETNATLTSGQAGWVSTPSSLDIPTRFLAGRESFPFVSNMDFPALRASAVGPAQTTAFADLSIVQDVQSWWNFAWGETVSRGSFTYIVNVERALILEVGISGHDDVEDLDLGVFRNFAGAPCEWDPALNDPLTGLPGYWKTCEVDPEEYREIDCRGSPCIGSNKWNYDADADADERVPWVAPQDGQFFIKVLGFTVPSGIGHFDLDVSVTLDTGTGYMVPEAPKPSEIVNGTGSGLPALTQVSLSLAWDFPSDTLDAPYGGAVVLGLPNAPGVIVIPVLVTLDRVAPNITGFRVTSLTGNLNVADNRTTDDRAPRLTVTLEDPDLGQLNRDAVRFLLEGTDVTPQTLISIQYTLRANQLGLWEGTATYTPADLPDGTYTVNATVGDRAGNLRNATFTFVIDGTAPILVVESPDVVYTKLDSYSVRGSTEPFAWFRLRGGWIRTDGTGAFSEPVALLNGTNSLVVSSTDWFDEDASGNMIPGNPISHTITIIRDLVPPEISRFTADVFATKETQVVVTGLVRDRFSALETGDPRTVAVTINGNTATIRADGSFREFVRLDAEGTNTIAITAQDLAGNQVASATTVKRDTTIPSLVFTREPPARTESQVVHIAGTTEAGASVTVNGISVPSPGGAFETEVTLSYGTRTVVVTAIDAVGNVDEERFTVIVVAPARTSPLLLPAALAIIGIAAIVALAFVLPRFGVRVPFMRSRVREEAPSSVESAPEEEKPPLAPETKPETMTEDERIGRLRKAFEEGRISKEAYEANLEKIRGPGQG